jgi:hypothetical protein
MIKKPAIRMESDRKQVLTWDYQGHPVWLNVPTMAELALMTAWRLAGFKGRRKVKLVSAKEAEDGVASS